MLTAQNAAVVMESDRIAIESEKTSELQSLTLEVLAMVGGGDGQVSIL